MAPHQFRSWLVALCLAASPAAALAADQQTAAAPAATTSVVILKTNSTGDGVPLVYPGGTPQILSRITTFPPHSKTAVHRHPMPLYVYMLEGQLTIHTEGQPDRHYKAGDAFMETAAWHYGENPGDTSTRLLAVYVGADGLPLAEAKN